jgi:hypothetical protein
MSNYVILTTHPYGLRHLFNVGLNLFILTLVYSTITIFLRAFITALLHSLPTENFINLVLVSRITCVGNKGFICAPLPLLQASNCERERDPSSSSIHACSNCERDHYYLSYRMPSSLFLGSNLGVDKNAQEKECYGYTGRQSELRKFLWPKN